MFKNSDLRFTSLPDTFRVAGFMSTSTSMDTALRFSGDACCLLIIYVPAGSASFQIPEALASHGQENEILLARNGLFVKKSQDSQIKYIVHGIDQYYRPQKQFVPISYGDNEEEDDEKMTSQTIKDNLEKISKDFFKAEVPKEMQNIDVQHKKMKLN